MPSPRPLSKDAQRAEFSRRLREELQRTGRQPSPSALAHELNLHLRASEQIHPSSCRKWLHAQSIPTQEKLIWLARLLQVSASWLRYGQMTELHESGPSEPPLSPEELTLLHHWRQLPAPHRRTVRMLMSQLIKSKA